MFTSKRRMFFLCFLILILFAGVDKASAATVSKRLMGEDRYRTAVAVSKEGWPDGSNYVILATGENFPDALSAAPLAKKYKAPILLTGRDVLNVDTALELRRLKVRQVYIIGGEGVISGSIENDIKQRGITPIRIAGEDRYETSIKIAEKIGTGTGIIVTTGLDFTDAVSAAPIAAMKGMPIILVPKDNITQAIRDYIDSLYYVKTYVINGSGLISSKIVDQFPDVEQITGGDKYERNINIINKFLGEIDFGSIYAATGNDYPDALAASALAQKSASAIVLLDNSKIPDVTSRFIKSKTIGEINILGGYGIIDYNTEVTLRNMPSQIQWAYDLTDTVYENQRYRFPNTIVIINSNNVKEEVPVTWNLSSVDTSRSGTYVYEGTVKGYDRKVTLRLIVEPVVASISNITTEIVQSQSYVFPKTVMAVMSDNTIREMPVEWTNEVVSINKPGSYTFSGQVKSSDKKCALTLNVVEDEIIQGMSWDFEYIIRKKIGKDDYSRHIYKSDILGITTLDIHYNTYGRHLYNISGIDNLVNLTQLNLDDNYISDLSPLQNLVNLRSLNLADNNISDVAPLQGLTNLTYLDLRDNSISDITGLQDLTGLTTLYLKDNYIHDYSPIRHYYNNLKHKDFTL